MDCKPTGSLSMGFSRQEYWSGLPFPSPGDLPEPGIKPKSPALQVYSLPSELLGEALRQAIHRTYRYVIQNGQRPLLQLLLWLPALCSYKDYRPPSSSAHGIFPAKILEWVTISFSRGSSWPRDWKCISCLAGRFFTTEPPGKTERLLLSL